MKKSLWIVVVIVIAAVLVAVRLKRVNEKEHAPLVPEVAIAVDAAPISSGTVVRTRHLLGTVLGADDADIAPRVMAQVLEIKVREGDHVARGEVLAVLDARELEDAVSQAEALVLSARQGLAAAETGETAQHAATERDRRLHEAGAVSDEQWERSQSADAAASAQLEAARAQVEVALKHLDQARTRLSYCHVTSPVAGLVARRLADPGDLAVPGKPLLEIVRQSTVRVRAEAPAEDLASLVVGVPLTLTLGDDRVETTISRVFPALSENHLVAFEADLDTPPTGFVAAAKVGVDVHLGSAEGLVAPADALLEGDSGAWVFTVVDSVVHPVQVEVLDRSVDEVVVSGPLEEGDVVVVAHPSRLMTLAEGMKVDAAPRTG